MLLNHLVLRNFKKYKRADITFHEGLTGITGGNGTGKSTIMEAIAWALYGNRASTIKREFIKNIHAGSDEPVEVYLTINLGKQELSIYRGMKGRSMIAEAWLSIDGCRVAAGVREVDFQLERILKISFQDFMKTFYARQKDLDNLLREGGTGKREYLLKLLGLDDVREAALETIKEDLRTAEGSRQRMVGALEEMGDLEGRIASTNLERTEAKNVLQEARLKEQRLSILRQEAREKVAKAEEKARSYDRLTTRKEVMARSLEENQQVQQKESQRLAEMESIKIQLSDLQPMLSELRRVQEELEALEPHQRLYQNLTRQQVQLQEKMRGLKTRMAEVQERLQNLRLEERELEPLMVKEKEYLELEGLLKHLEGLRTQFFSLSHEIASQEAQSRSLRSRVEELVKVMEEMGRAKERLRHLTHLPARRMEILRRLEELEEERQKLRRLEDLRVRLKDLQQHEEGEMGRLTALQSEMASLGDLEMMEIELQGRDRAIDSMQKELTNQTMELQSQHKLAIKAMRESREAFKKISEMGTESLCPTCERPLEGQRDLLLEKYRSQEREATLLLQQMQSRGEELRSKGDDLTRDRSYLKGSFDRLNASKARRAGIQAGLEGIRNRLSEISRDMQGLAEVESDLGTVCYNPQEHRELQRELQEMEPLLQEYAVLSSKIEEFQTKEEERQRLERQLSEMEGRKSELAQQLARLGYREDDHVSNRHRLDLLKADHERFQLLSLKVKDIPVQTQVLQSRREEMASLEAQLQKTEVRLQSLCFYPQKYDDLRQRSRDLSRWEKEAHELQLLLSGEEDCRQRLAVAERSITAMEADLFRLQGEIQALSYSPEELDRGKDGLRKLEEDLDLVRGEVTRGELRLQVLERDLTSLEEERNRAEEYRRQLSFTDRRLRVLDLSRQMISRFLDSILVKVRDDIAQVAGEILEDLAGKYSLVKIDEDFVIWVEEGGEFYPISRFSGGEIDMIAVSVRVAISEYLMRWRQDGQGYSFLILDEVFGSQDLEHRERMIGMLRRLESRFPQIFAISHISDVQGQFDSTITVREDAMGNSVVSVED